MRFKYIQIFILLFAASCSNSNKVVTNENTLLKKAIADKAERLKDYQTNIPERATQYYNIYLQAKAYSDSICSMIRNGVDENYLRSSVQEYAAFISGNVSYEESEFPIQKYIHDELETSNNITIEQIQIIENEILTHLLDDVFMADLKLFDSYTAIPYGGSEKVPMGKDYEANIMMAVSSSQFPFKLVFSEENWRDTLTLDQAGLIKIDQSKYKLGKNHFEPTLLFQTEKGIDKVPVFIDFEVK